MPIMLFDAILIQPKKANVMQPDCYAIIFFCLLINQNSLQIRDNMEMKYNIEICSIDSLIIQYCMNRIMAQNLILLHQSRFYYILPNTFEASMNILHLIVQNLLLLHQFRFNYIQKQT